MVNPVSVFKDRAYKHVWVAHCSLCDNTCGCCAYQEFATTQAEAFNKAMDHIGRRHQEGTAR